MGLFNKNNEIAKELAALRQASISQTEAINALKQKVENQKEALVLLSQTNVQMTKQTGDVLNDVSTALKELSKLFNDLNESIKDDDDATKPTPIPRSAVSLNGMTMTIDPKYGRLSLSANLAARVRSYMNVGLNKYHTAFRSSRDKNKGNISTEFALEFDKVIRQDACQLPFSETFTSGCMRIYNKSIAQCLNLKEKATYKVVDIEENVITFQLVES